MRTVNLATFLTLPAGTVYAPLLVKDQSFETLYVKKETVGQKDFFFTRLLGEIEVNPDWPTLEDTVVDMMLNGQRYPIKLDAGERWGAADDGAWFVVYEHDDLTKLIGALSRCVLSTYKPS